MNDLLPIVQGSFWPDTHYTPPCPSFFDLFSGKDIDYVYAMETSDKGSSLEESNKEYSLFDFDAVGHLPSLQMCLCVQVQVCNKDNSQCVFYAEEAH